MHGLRGGLVAYLHEAQGEIVGLLLNADLVEDVKESWLRVTAKHAGKQ